MAEVAATDTARRVPTEYKKHRAGTKRTGAVGLVKLLQLSAAGEVFLEGTCPLSRCPQTAKFPAPCFWRTGKVGEKSDSFSRAERTRPLRPVCRLLLRDFENVPVEHFQRHFPFLKPADTARRVPTKPKRTEHLANCAQLDQPDKSNDLVSFCFCTMRFVIAPALMHPAILRRIFLNLPIFPLVFFRIIYLFPIEGTTQSHETSFQAKPQASVSHGTQMRNKRSVTAQSRKGGSYLW